MLKKPILAVIFWGAQAVECLHELDRVSSQFQVSQKMLGCNTEVADLAELPAVKKANLCHCSLI